MKPKKLKYCVGEWVLHEFRLRRVEETRVYWDLLALTLSNSRGSCQYGVPATDCFPATSEAMKLSAHYEEAFKRIQDEAAGLPINSEGIRGWLVQRWRTLMEDKAVPAKSLADLRGFEQEVMDAFARVRKETVGGVQVFK
jgi:hypothetical protein